MKNFSTILSSSLGNILEWYDFGLFTIFSSLFSRLFFPAYDTNTALIATFSIFAVGFVCRPIGALLFGYLGDKSGRASTLRLSVLTISLPTLLIGILPTYEHVGILAPILLIFIRIWQGISIGGEYSGNLIYLSESAVSRYRGTITAFASMGSNLGILLAAIVGIITTNVFSQHSLESWGWRIPYIISGLFSLFMYFFRLHLKETNVFDYLKEHKLLVRNPIKTVFKDNSLQLLRTIGLVCMGSTFYYFCFAYLPIYLQQNLHVSVNTVSTVISSFIGMMIILNPISGFICDKFGRRKMFLFNASFIALLVIPGFYILQFNYFASLILVLSLFTLASSLEQGTTSVAVVENFPAPARYTGVSLGYNIGNGFLGGTVPIMCEWLIAKTSLVVAPAFYIAGCAMVTGIVVYLFMPETKGKSLRRME